MVLIMEKDDSVDVMERPYKTLYEPFRIRSIESIPNPSRTDREAAMSRSYLNLFGLTTDEIIIDLLTDSGTGAMSIKQWAGIMLGDETYAGSRSGAHFVQSIQGVTGHAHVFPVHQGRAAERILMASMLKPGDRVISNTHFDTTRANVEQVSASAIDLPCVPSTDPTEVQPFNGNIDLDRLSAELDRGGVALVIITITNNAAGGQPVSMGNLESARELCQAHQVPLFLDAARFAENAWFIQQHEPGFRDWSIREVVGCMFSLADGFTLSAKKDGMANIGGVLATQSAALAETFRGQLPIGEGHPSYGGLSGRDLEAVAIGIKEAMDPAYLAYRARSVAYLAEGLKAVGMPIVEPPGGHAVFVDAGKILPHIPPEQFPAQALGLSFYLEGGVRGVEVGSLMFPGADRELLRLAMPRRTYTQAHMDYVVEVAERVLQNAGDLRGVKILTAPAALRHFTAKLAWA